MNYFQTIGIGCKAFFGNNEARKTLLEKPNIGFSFITILIAALIGSGMSFLFYSIFSSDAGPFAGISFPALFSIFLASSLVLSVLVTGATHLLARAFGGTGSFKTYYCTTINGGAISSFGSNFLSLIPFINGLANITIAIFGIMYTFNVIKDNYQLPGNKAGWVIGISISIFMIIFLVAIGIYIWQALSNANLFM